MCGEAGHIDVSTGNFSSREMERVKGIEPSYEAWEAAVLPLNYTRRPAEFYSGPGAVSEPKVASHRAHSSTPRTATSSRK